MWGNAGQKARARRVFSNQSRIGKNYFRPQNRLWLKDRRLPIKTQGGQFQGRLETKGLRRILYPNIKANYTSPDAAGLTGNSVVEQKSGKGATCQSETSTQIIYSCTPRSMPQSADEEEAQPRNTYRPIYSPWHPRPVEVSE